MKERNLNIDALRILSCIFVIGIHATYNSNQRDLWGFNNYKVILLHSIPKTWMSIFNDIKTPI